MNDPRTGECRYVGKADNPFVRFKKHLHSTKKTPVSCWIRSLLSQGLTPHMDLLDEVPVSQWGFWEREYIRVFRAVRVPLLNLSEGGEGLGSGENNPRFGKKNSAQANEKNRKAHLGKSVSPEAREKISASKKGKRLSSEVCAKMSASHMGKPWSELRRARFEARKET